MGTIILKSKLGLCTQDLELFINSKSLVRTLLEKIIQQSIAIQIRYLIFS